MPPRPCRLGLLVNPSAGSGQGRRLGDALRQRLRSLQSQHSQPSDASQHSQPSDASQHSSAAVGAPAGLVRRRDLTVVDLSRSTARQALTDAREAVESGSVDVLAVVGGDGMVSLGLQAVLDTSVPLLVVPAGTGNDFARSLGLPLPPDGEAAVVGAASEAVSGFLALDEPTVPGATEVPAAAAVGHTVAPACELRRVDIAVATLADESRVPIGCVLSVGLDAIVNATANRMRWPRGPRRYELAVLRELPRFRPPQLRVQASGPDGEVELERSVTLIAVANTPTYGGGLRMAPDAVVSDGLLDLVVVGALPRRTVLRLFPQVRTGAHRAHEAVEMRRVRSIVVREETPAGIAYADGEPLGPLPIRVDVAPSAVVVLLPASAAAVAAAGAALRAGSPAPPRVRDDV